MDDKSVFGFQWHITDRCNLRRKHCYRDHFSGSNELDLNGLKQIASEIIKTLAKWGKKGDIAITGGEPLVKTEMLLFSGKKDLKPGRVLETLSIKEAIIFL